MSYDWKKTLWKAGKSLIYIIIAGVFVVYANQPWLIAIAPMLHSLENYLKHRDKGSYK